MATPLKQRTLFQLGVTVTSPAGATSELSAAKRRKPNTSGLTQTRIDAGQKGQSATTCKDCGMIYQSGTSDDALHKSQCVALMKFPNFGKIATACGDNDGSWYVPPTQFRVAAVVAMMAMASCNKLVTSDHRLAVCLDPLDKTLSGVLVVRVTGDTKALLKVVVQWLGPNVRTVERQTAVCDALMAAIRHNAIYGYVVRVDEIEL